MRMCQLLRVFQIAIFINGFIKLADGSSSSSECLAGLGLENGAIPDDSISSNIETTYPPHAGRLNSRDSAWCFTSFLFKRISFLVDLGDVKFITGFQSQGPPKSLYNASYLRYVGLRVQLSSDGENWRDCCGDEHRVFYADDRGDEANVISTHSFHGLEAARFIRIDPITNVRWIGHEEKCFRFEILGCQVEGRRKDHFQPEIDFEYESLPAGYISTNWHKPTAIVAGRENVTLNVPFFFVNITIRGSQWQEMYNVSDHLLILSNPFWGAEYHFKFTCIYQGIAMDCGEKEATGIVRVAKSCFAHSAICKISNHVIFALPEVISATSLSNGSSLIIWTDRTRGWRAPKVRLSINNPEGREKMSVEEQADDEQHGPIFETGQVLVSDLQEGEEYEFTLRPSGRGISGGAKGFKSTLVTMQDASVSPDSHSFISSLSLEASVQWNGGLKARWRRARALMKTGSEISEIRALGYNVSLRYKGETVVNTITLPYEENEAVFGGIQMNTFYQIHLTCLFPDEAFYDCGEVSIFTNRPVYVIERPESPKSSIYAEMMNPNSWPDLEEECQMSGGNLVSLVKPSLESSLAENLMLSSFWSGGNMCPDSPAPPDSLWSSGVAKLNYTNFSPESGLDGKHCCIKVSVVDGNYSEWRGENCQSILKGVCEFHVTDYLDMPTGVTASNKTATSLNISWTMKNLNWQPTTFEVQYCFIKSVSKASVPISGPVCHGQENLNGSLETFLSDLKPFSEYKITVIGSHDMFEKQSEASIQIRTLPETDVEWSITPDGQLIVSWVKKIAEYEEENEVVGILTNLNTNETDTFKGNAVVSTVENLEFGGSYEILLTDITKNESFGPIYFEAYPNCSRGIRIDMTCNYVSTRPFHLGDIKDECSDFDFKGFNLPTTKDLLKEHKLSKSQQHFWIGKEETKEFSPNGNPDVVHQRSSRIYEDQNVSCQAWNARRSSYEWVSCDLELPIICQGSLNVESSSPTQDSIDVVSGPTYVQLDWDVPQDGWTHVFKVKAVPKQSLNQSTASNGTSDEEDLDRVGRNYSSDAEVWIKSSRPPIKITNLLPETNYKVVIETVLHPEWSRTLEIENVETTANGSDLPEEIIGYTAISKDIKAAHFSIFSILIIILAISVMIFALSGTLPVYSDNVVQVCFEVSVICCYISLLLAAEDAPLTWNDKNITACVLAVALLNFTILAAFLFLFLESLIIAVKLIKSASYLPIIENSLKLILIGFLVPFIYTIIAVPSVYKSLIPDEERMCWLNLRQPMSAIFIVPNVILLILTLTLLLASMFMRKTSQLVPSTYDIRESTLEYTRYVMLVVTVLFGLTWCLGITAAHFQRNSIFISFLFFHFVLALVILIFRCLYDRQVWARLKRLRKSNDELGEDYHASRINSAIHPNGRRWRNDSSSTINGEGGKKRSVFSARSRQSIISHISSNQVAPQITPVEVEDQEEAQPQVSQPVSQNGQAVQQNLPSKAGDGHLHCKSSRLSSTSCANLSPLLNMCGWNHTENAIWQELERQSPQSVENQKALRKFKRLCSESYTPTTSRSYSAETMRNQLSDSSGEKYLESPAEYITPFGDTNARPVLLDSHGRLLPLNKNRSLLLGDEIARINLPHIPDTEDVMKIKADQLWRNLQLATHVTGKSCN